MWIEGESVAWDTARGDSPEVRAPAWFGLLLKDRIVLPDFSWTAIVLQISIAHQ
jgi:hypothetical protein